MTSIEISIPLIPGNESVLSGAGHGEGPDGVSVSVAVTVVVVPASVAAGPHEDAALPLPPVSHAVDEGSAGQVTGAVHRLAVIVRAPRGTDINELKLSDFTSGREE